MRSARFEHALVIWLLLCPLPATAAGEDAYPVRPIQLVVPFTPGGGSDTFARIIKKAIDDERLLPQPLVILNMDGAGGTIGSRRVKNADPDGYTIMILHEAIVSAKYAGQAAYGPEAFAAIAGTGRMGLVVAVRDDSPYESLRQLLESARAVPSRLVFSANLGAPVHFVGLSLEQSLPGARFRFAQSGGGTKRLHALRGGHAALTAFSIEEFLRYESAGIRAVAYCGPERHPALPHVPTTFEQGIELEHVNMQFWWAPRGTPAERIEVLAEALRKAMQTAYVRSHMAQIHCDPVFLSADQMHEEIRRQQAMIEQIDLRPTIGLPPVAAAVLLATAAMLAVVSLQSWRQWLRAAVLPWQQQSSPALQIRLACGMCLLTSAYVLALANHWLPFRWATLIFVFAAVTLLGQRTPRHLGLAALLAAVTAVGIDLLFSRVFQFVLP